MSNEKHVEKCLPFSPIPGRIPHLYDHAYKVLGDKWRMPTVDELKELVDKCEWHWVDVNGVVGYRVTGRNGNSIFLPSIGNGNTYYWSASKASKYKCFYYLYFNSYNFDIMYNLLSGHNYIRPIMKTK